MQPQHIGLIGYGEVGKTFSAGLKDKPGVAGTGVPSMNVGQASGAPATAEKSGVPEAPAGTGAPFARRGHASGGWSVGEDALEAL